jgi:hypothetical protein
MGKDSASSAQSKCRGVGIEHGGTELDELLARDGGRKTVAVGSVDVPVATEDTGVGETVRLQPIWGKPGGTGIFSDVDGERGERLCSLIVVRPFFDNRRCSSCWQWEYCRWGLSLSLCEDMGAEVRGAHTPRFLDGFGVRGIGGGTIDDVATLGKVGAGETTRLPPNGVVLGGVRGMWPLFGKGSPSMGKGLAGVVGLGDPAVVWLFFVNVGVSPSFGHVSGFANDDVGLPGACRAVSSVLVTFWT